MVRVNIIDNLDNLDTIHTLDTIDTNHIIDSNYITNNNYISDDLENNIKNKYNLIDTLLKDLYKPDISIINLLNEIYTTINLIETTNKYKKFYNKSNKILLDDICYCLLKNRTYKHLVKEYFQLLKYDDEIINNIEKITNKLEKKNIGILNIFSGVGTLLNKIIDNFNYKYIEYWDQDDSIVNLLKLINCSKNIYINKTDIIHSNDIKSGHDLIIGNIPDNIKNIIYSKCCDKIKELKIRGTKSEPLIVQLIMQLLGDSGSAIIIVANSFLFGDSKQHIETRKYIYENTSNIEVIQLKSIKSKSILFFTKNINSSLNNIILSNNIITNENIIKNNYSFYYPNYVFMTQNTTNDLISLGEIIQITDFNENKKYNYKLLYSLNNHFYINENIAKYDYLFLTQNEELYKQEFLNNYLKKIFINNTEIITKGKTKILEIEKIKQLKIKPIPINIQNEIINLNNLNLKLTEINNLQSESLEHIKNNIIIDYINNINNFVKLSDIATITNHCEQSDVVIIYKNSNLAGTVSRSLEQCKSDNIYFINSSSLNFSNDFIYYYLKFKEDELINLSKMNNSVNLARKYLESFNIPILDITTQKLIIEKIEHINNIKYQYNVNYNIVDILNFITD
jgi:hypothetical protein